jgi:hypothetical protein
MANREYVSFKTLMCGDREIKLRYGAGALFSIRDTAATVIGKERLERIKYTPIDGKVPVEIAIRFIDSELDVLLWFFGKGLEWAKSGAKPEEANDLYDAYMDVAEADLDTGERFEEFKSAIAGAILAARGISLKKFMEKQKADQEKHRQAMEESLVGSLGKKVLELEQANEALQIQLSETQTKLAEVMRKNLKAGNGMEKSEPSSASGS